MMESRATGNTRCWGSILVHFLVDGDTDACGTESIGGLIDYPARDGIATRAEQATIERAPTYALRWSDYAPVTVQYR